MTDLTDLCAAALVATRHAYEDEDNASLWIKARDAWSTAAKSARAARDESLTFKAAILEDAIMIACHYCDDARWLLQVNEKHAAASRDDAMKAAKNAMTWLD